MNNTPIDLILFKKVNIIYLTWSDTSWAPWFISLSDTWKFYFSGYVCLSVWIRPLLRHDLVFLWTYPSLIRPKYSRVHSGRSNSWTEFLLFHLVRLSSTGNVEMNLFAITTRPNTRLERILFLIHKLILFEIECCSSWLESTSALSWLVSNSVSSVLQIPSQVC